MKTWLITECSSGFGRNLAETLLSEGEQVIVTARKPKTIQHFAKNYPLTALCLRLDVTKKDTIATVIGSARFSTNDEAFFTQVNQLLVDDRKKIVIIACIELDATDDKERKAQMSVWMQKLKQKLSWLHAVKISINPVDNITALLPDTEVSFI